MFFSFYSNKWDVNLFLTYKGNILLLIWCHFFFFYRFIFNVFSVTSNLDLIIRIYFYFEQMLIVYICIYIIYISCNEKRSNVKNCTHPVQNCVSSTITFPFYLQTHNMIQSCFERIFMKHMPCFKTKNSKRSKAAFQEDPKICYLILMQSLCWYSYILLVTTKREN